MLGAIPYLIGFHPSDGTLVAIGLRQRQLHVMARTILPRVVNRVEAIVHGFRSMLGGSDVDGVILVGYGSQRRFRTLMPALFVAVPGFGATLLEALRADGGRYWSYLCTEPGCCPPAGTRYDVRDSEIAAEATLAGLIAVADEDSYLRLLEPVPGADRHAMAEATARSQQRLHHLIATAADETALIARLTGEGVAAIRRATAVQRTDRPLDDESVAWLALLVEWAEVHDLAWDRINTTGDHSRAARRLWLEVMRRTAPDLIPGPGSLFALAAWHLGEVVLARRALARVREIEPDYPPAVFLDDAITAGVPPSVLRDWLRDRKRSTVDSEGIPLNRSPGRRPRRRSSSGRAESRPA